MNVRVLLVVTLMALPSGIVADDTLGQEKLALLQDTSGWEYLSMDNSQNGFPTQHTCFDGSPHPDECRGRLTLTRQNRFVQQVTIQHQTVARHGSYQLNGDKLAFYDEFGTQDGPYTVEIDAEKKLMAMDMPQVKVRLILYKEYRKQLEEARKNKKQ